MSKDIKYWDNVEQKTQEFCEEYLKKFTTAAVWGARREVRGTRLGQVPSARSWKAYVLLRILNLKRCNGQLKDDQEK